MELPEHKYPASDSEPKTRLMMNTYLMYMESIMSDYGITFTKVTVPKKTTHIILEYQNTVLFDLNFKRNEEGYNLLNQKLRDEFLPKLAKFDFREELEEKLDEAFGDAKDDDNVDYSDWKI